MIAKILIADDNDALRGSLKDYLESKHHIVLEATDGAQAFAIADSEHPHLIIMDVVMPGVYGTTASKQLREFYETATIPIIIMSGSVDLPVLEKSVLSKENFRYLKKPLDLKKLEETIAELLPEGGFTR